MLKSRFSFAHFLIVMMAFTMLIIQPVQAQSFEYNEDAVKVSFTSAVDSAGTVYSDWFSIPDYLSYSFYDYPVNYTKIQSSVLRVPVITVTVEGSNDQTNIVITDTIGTVGDSLETYYNGNTNFNNKKFWYYRLKYVGVGTHPFDNATDATLRTDLVFIRPRN